jgi:hypothetical protein
MILSVNGSDDELAYVRTPDIHEKDDIATVLGTHGYKMLENSYRVFEMLRRVKSQLKLVIIGDEKGIPPQIRQQPSVSVKGVSKRPDVMEILKKSKYYISTTLIENSYNAASEGVFCAEESFISDIGPHRELLDGMRLERVSVPGVHRPLLHVRRADLTAVNLKSWNDVIVDMISHVGRIGTARPVSVSH